MKRINGITYLKAFLPLIVISCHIRPFGKSSFMSYPFPKFPDLKDIYYINISSLAVTLFFIISLFLYLLKRSRSQGSSIKVLRSRVFYFVKLFVIWRIIYVIFNIGNIWVKDRGLFQNVYHLLFGGGDTLLYYLEISVYLFVILELFCLLIEKSGLNKVLWSSVGLLFSLVLLLFLNFILPPGSLKAETLRFFSPVAFLPYVFVAVLMFEFSENIKGYKLIILFFIGAFFAVLEWLHIPDKIFLDYGYSLAIPCYARISTVLISITVFGFMIKIKKSPSKFVEYLSGLSLYVYCTHQIIINLLNGVFSKLPFVSYLVVAMISYALSIAIYTLKNYISKLKIRRNKNESGIA